MYKVRSAIHVDVFLGVYAYVTLKENVKTDEEDLKKELKMMVKKAIGGHAVPEMIQVD